MTMGIGKQRMGGWAVRRRFVAYFARVASATRALRGSLARMMCASQPRDAGMSTAEYAIGTVAACAFAALLYKVVTSTQVLSLLMGVITRALHVPF